MHPFSGGGSENEITQVNVGGPHSALQWVGAGPGRGQWTAACVTGVLPGLADLVIPAGPVLVQSLRPSHPLHSCGRNCHSVKTSPSLGRALRHPECLEGRGFTSKRLWLRRVQSSAEAQHLEECVMHRPP